MGDPFIDALDSLYAAPLQQGAWEVPLTAIASALGAASAVLLFQDRSPDTPPNSGEVIAITGFPDHAAALYYNEFAPHDYRMSQALVAPAGTVFADEWNLDYDRYRRSHIYNGFYRPLGVDRIMGIRLFDGDRTATLSVFAPPGRGPWQAGDLHLLGRFAPHLTRSLQLKRQVDRAEAVAAGLRLGLDHFAMAVLLLDGKGHVLVANRAAEALLSRADTPLRLRQNRLAALHAADAAALERHIAATRNPAAPPSPVMRLRSRDGSAVFGLMAVRTGGRLSGTLVFINDPGTPAVLSPAVLSAQLGLSMAEAEVVTALCVGMPSAEVARQRGVGLATVRSQIKSALARTNTNSQGGLITLAARSLAALVRR